MSSLDSIPVSRVMSSPVRTIRDKDTVQQACKTMVDNNISSVIVVAEPGAPEGIITERDVVRHFATEPISFEAPSSKIMSTPIVTIHPNGSLRIALETMRNRDIRRLAVVGDDGKDLMGIVTVKDIFRFISRNQSASSAFVTEEVLARNREMADRFSTSLLDDIIYRRA